MTEPTNVPARSNGSEGKDYSPAAKKARRARVRQENTERNRRQAAREEAELQEADDLFFLLKAVGIAKGVPPEYQDWDVLDAEGVALLARWGYRRPPVTNQPPPEGAR